MATQFQSATRRINWLTSLFSGLVNLLVAFLIFLFFDNSAGAAFVYAIVAVVALYISLILYALLGVAKTAVIFYWFDKKTRVQAAVDQMVALRMPKPSEFYTDASEYLLSVVKSDQASNDAKLFAGQMLGGIDTLRDTYHGYLLFNFGLVLEEAIQQYGRQVGFEDLDDED